MKDTPPNVTFCGKNDFAGVIKLRLLRWGVSPGLCDWPEMQPHVSLREGSGERFDAEEEKAVWPRGQRQE